MRSRTLRPDRFFTIRSRFATIIALAALGGTADALLPGCASREPPEISFVPPPIELVESHFFGTPLSGPRAGDPAGLTEDDSFGVRVTVFGLETLPDGALDPISARRTLLAVTGSGKPIQAAERLSRGIRLGPVERAETLLASFEDGTFGRTAAVAQADAAVPPGSACRFRLTLAPRAADSPAPELFDLEVFSAPARGGSERAIQAAIVREGAIPAEDEDEGPSAEPDGPTDAYAKAQPETPPPEESLGLRETSLVEGAFRTVGDALAAILPVEAGPVAGYAFVLELTFAPGGTPDGAHAEAFRRCGEALAKVAGGEVRLAEVQSELLDPTVLLKRAAEALSDQATRRRALIYIAGETGARVAADLALSGSDELVGTVSEAILKRLAETKEFSREETIGWAFEAGTLHAVAGLLEKEERPPELEGILALHLGQVGRQAAAVERVVARSRSLQDLEASLVEENFTFLEDSLPQARARALEWLAARGRAPEGYDPLAPSRERRTALEKAATEPTSTDAQGGDS